MPTPTPIPVREQVLAAVHGRMAAFCTPAVTGGPTLYRNRRKEVPDAAMPALNMLDGGHDDPAEEAAYTEYPLTVSVDGFVKATADEALGPALSDLHARVVAALLADRTLGGVAVDLTEGGMVSDLNHGTGTSPQAKFTQFFTVRFWTKHGDPYTAGP